MHRLCTLLGMPQHRFASIHVVGTNGKTSVTRMTAALLDAHGTRAGAYLSPHIHSWRERIVIDGEPIAEEAFVQALERAEQSAQVADRSAGEEGPVTQYELLTAAAFVAFVQGRVPVAVIEAGLGGRLDATNVIPSQVTVLTSVGLDHTEWLGDTLEEIAGEKLAVLRDHTSLVTGPVPPEVEPVIEGEVNRRHATRFELDPDERWDFLQADWTLARAAATVYLGAELRPDAVKEAAERLSNPGRAQLVPGDPPEIFDAAHNAPGARALAELLPDLAAGRPVLCCLAVMADKDAAGIVEALAPACEAFVCTEVPPEAMEHSGRPGAPSRSADELARLCGEAGADGQAIPDPSAAWERARELAAERRGVALAAGSHYLLKCIWTERHAESS